VPDKESSTTSTIWILLFIAGALAVFTIAAFAAYDGLKVADTWQKRAATIATSRLESGNGVHLDITVRLEGETKTRPSKLILGTFISQSDYRHFAKKYPQGKNVVLYQHPTHPEKLVLEANTNPVSLYVPATLAGLLGVLFLYVVFRMFRAAS
jgi:hypothetical protein